ncbi:alcohol acetyltransferase [Halteromyces radiatus]|uniref:alcohol acetyltransferase n=1 Tax=Halteromyces radiatus TaxID=101107 RepID=UPI00221ECDDE|nr:alcohol acetyltransferase [Halteromyces radiatus]KAI8099648.1 alcohol acetyltransferase [Halteromyces radiatus]
MTISSSNSSSKQRNLGLLEKYQASKTLTQGYGSVTCTAQVRHQIQRKDNATTFYLTQFHPAITRLVQRYPFLSLVVRDFGQSTAHFIHVSSFSLSSMIHVTTSPPPLDEAIASACDKELLSTDSDTDIPPWRLHILVQPDKLDECTIIFIAHHIIIDGKSLALFWAAFLQELNNDNDISTTIQTSSPNKDDSWLVHTDTLAPMSLPSPMELRSDIPKPSVFDYASLFGGILKKWIPFGRQMEFWEGDSAAVDGEAHSTMIKLRELGGDAWKMVLQLAKQKYNNISIHAVVHAAFLLAWAEIYPDQATMMTTPINCRQQANAHLEIGNFVGVYEHAWTPDVLLNPPSSLTDDVPLVWRLAHHYHTILQTKKHRSCVGAHFLGLLDYPNGYIDYWKGIRKEHRMGRAGGLEHSDLGRFDDPGQNNPWTLDSLWFSQSAQIFSMALGLNTITLNNVMYASFVWQYGSLDEAKVTLVMDRFIDILQHSVQQ